MICVDRCLYVWVFFVFISRGGKGEGSFSDVLRLGTLVYFTIFEVDNRNYLTCFWNSSNVWQYGPRHSSKTVYKIRMAMAMAFDLPSPSPLPPPPPPSPCWTTSSVCPHLPTTITTACEWHLGSQSGVQTDNKIYPYDRRLPRICVHNCTTHVNRMEPFSVC